MPLDATGTRFAGEELIESQSFWGPHPNFHQSTDTWRLERKLEWRLLVSHKVAGSRLRYFAGEFPSSWNEIFLSQIALRIGQRAGPLRGSGSILNGILAPSGVPDPLTPEHQPSCWAAGCRVHGVHGSFGQQLKFIPANEPCSLSQAYKTKTPHADDTALCCDCRSYSHPPGSLQGSALIQSRRPRTRSSLEPAHSSARGSGPTVTQTRYALDPRLCRGRRSATFHLAGMAGLTPHAVDLSSQQSAPPRLNLLFGLALGFRCLPSWVQHPKPRPSLGLDWAVV